MFVQMASCSLAFWIGRLQLQLSGNNGRWMLLRTMSTAIQDRKVVFSADRECTDAEGNGIGTAPRAHSALIHAHSSKVKFLGVYIGAVNDSSKVKRQYEKALEKRRRVIHRLRMLQKQRKESWEKEVGRIAVNAFTRGYRKALSTLRSGSKAKQAIFDKATELGMKAALTLADQQPLLGLADYKRLLEEEEDHFARLGWDFLPGSVKVAYEGLLLAMDEACHELKVQSAIIKSRQVLPTENQHFYLSEACSLGSDSDSTEQIQLASARPMTEEMRSIDKCYGNEVAAERQRPASVYCVEEVLERIANPDSLQAAYERIKSKLQIMSMKTDDEWNDFGWKLFTQSAQSLRTGTYKFTPVNIIQVRKPGKEGSVRPVVVVNPKDQIVVEAIRFELEKIYEPIFLKAAHRYQASRSCHMAIKYIKNGWKGTTWFIQFKSQTTYNRAHLEKLLSILSTHIKDKQFLNLLKEMMRMGLLNLVDPGSQFSALLCNIFYHQLDLEVARIKADWSTGSKHQEMSSASYSSLHLDQKMLATTRGNLELKTLGKQQGPERSGHAQGAGDIKTRRVHYVRYAEEFLFGIKGTKTMALDVLERVQMFLQTELKLQMP